MAKPNAPTNPRAVAAQVLAQVLTQHKSLAMLLPPACQQVGEANKGILQEMCYGVCRLMPQLRGAVDQLLKKPLRDKDTDVYALLLIGCYQLSHMRVPDHAAISETVDAAKQLKKVWAKGFINGVLRQYSRRQQILEDNLSPYQAAAHPQWLYEKINKHWPEQKAEIIAANNQAGPMTLRVNAQHYQRSDYLALLQERDISATPCEFSPDGITLEHACDVNTLPGFNDGHCSIQDEAAQLAAGLMLQQQPQRVLDACCAPGGKTGHLLEQANIDVDALDIDEQRLERVSENLHRLGLTANLITASAQHTEQWWNGQLYDAILLDAPCSATGVIRRNPDIKMLRKPQDIVKLAALQQTLLKALWPCVKPGGILVYATCSIIPDENSDTISTFLANTADASELLIDANWGISQPFGRQLLPNIEGSDGFYYACLKKQ